MKTVLKLVKTIGITLLALIAFILLYVLAALGLSRITVDAEKNSKKEIAIYIMTNGVHTDLVLPVRTELVDWSKEVKFENTVQKDTDMQYLALGWGDKGFYLETPTWADLKASTAFNAAFALSTSAIHATYYKQLKEAASCVKIEISKDQYARLAQYIQNSFDKDGDGHFINIKTTANYGRNDAFYEAKGSYNLFRTCNTWANNGLKSCGQKAALWTPSDKGIFLHYQK